MKISMQVPGNKAGAANEGISQRQTAMVGQVEALVWPKNPIHLPPASFVLFDGIKPAPQYGDVGGPLLNEATGEPVMLLASRVWDLQQLAGGGDEVGYYARFGGSFYKDFLLKWLGQGGSPGLCLASLAANAWCGDYDYPTGEPCQTAQDPDCDHIYTVDAKGKQRDNCPTVYNPEQTNGDGDFFGDVCDNCPNDYNPTQDNCNREAEIAVHGSGLKKGVTELGDACDPRPCPRAGAETEGLILSPSKTTTACTELPKATLEKCAINVETAVRWQGIVAGPRSGKWGNVELGHCVCKDQHSTPEHRLAFCQQFGGQTQCISGESHAFPLENTTPNVTSGWKAVTLTVPLPSPGPFDASGENFRYPTVFQPANALDQVWSWRFEADLAKFGAWLPGPVSKPADLDAVAAAMQGVGWAFTVKFPGLPLVDFPGTKPVNKVDGDAAGSYFRQDLQPRYDSTVLAAVKDVVGHMDINPCPVMPCPCATKPCGDPAMTWPWIVAKGAENVFTVQNGRFTKVSGVPGQLGEFFGAVGDTIDLVGASEPGSALDARGVDLRAVGIDKATDLPIALLWSTPAGPAAESFGCPALACDRLDPPAGPGTGLARALSALNGELYVVRRTTAAAPEELAVLDLARTTVTGGPVAGGAAHGRPIALTYRMRDDALYLLDEILEGKKGFLRLSRLSRAGVLSERGRVPWVFPGGTVFLTTTYDDRLLFATSGPSVKGGHALYVLLEPTGDAVHVVAWRFDAKPGKLVLPPDALSPTRYYVAKAVPGEPGVELSDFAAAAFAKLPPKPFHLGLPELF